MANLRIGGLASGMDIDQIVGDMMKAERVPLNKLFQKKQQLEWRRDDYRSMNTLLFNFRTELTNMKLSSNYRARTVSSSLESNVTATASSAASQGSFNISNVTQMASAATKVNSGAVSGDTRVDHSVALFSQKNNFANGWTWKEGSVEIKSISPTTNTNTIALDIDTRISVDPVAKMQVKVDGILYEFVSGVTDPTSLGDKQVSYDPATKNLLFKNEVKSTSTVKVDYIADRRIEGQTLTADTTEIQFSKGSIKTINSLTMDGNQYSVDTNTGEVKLQSDGTIKGILDLNTGKLTMNDIILKDSVIEMDYTQNYFDFSLKTYTSKGEVTENFAVQGNETMSNVISKVNSSSLGLTMFYDSVKDQFTLTRTETGNFNGAGSKDISFSESDHEIITSGDFLDSALRFSGVQELGGDNIKFNINGLATERTKNTFEMNGVSFTVKQLFTEPVSISVNNDSNKVYENIKSFVEKYNELIDKIQKKTSEELYRNYLPLTEEQRETLTDKQQEQWEEKAKSGLLRRDPLLTQVLSKMRSDLYTPVVNEEVNPVFKQLASIGITTTPNYLEGGKLLIDEGKLKKAIEEDPTSVEKLFNANGTTDSSIGVVQRLYNSISSAMDNLKTKAGNAFSTNQQFTLGRELLNVNSQIQRFEDRLSQIENRYWKQFTAMEKAIQQANSQSTYLMQQFGGM
jgi:flagellar hook-associated protein 2